MTNPFPDFVLEGTRKSWQTYDGAQLSRDLNLSVDVVVVGTGAGGGTAAEIFAQSGLRVALIEEGPLRSNSDFRMREEQAYAELYQESAARKTRDKAITILQGRCVGGGTTVNWTSSFRTPTVTLEHWREHYGWQGFSETELEPWFAKMEQRLSIAPWPVAPNENNDILRRGAAALGIPTAAIRRNVKGCLNIGYCGLGCPTNAKQSMLVTTIPAALEQGALLVSRARAERLVHRRNKVLRLECVALDEQGIHPRPYKIAIEARYYVLAAGAIGTPALLLRSQVPDPHLQIGRRTFLHPTVATVALMEQSVAGYYGAPQTIYSDHYLDTLPLDGPMGFKLEAPPIHPLLASTVLPGHGEAHAVLMRRLPHWQVVIALLRDGFHPESSGGRVLLRNDGSPVLDYPISDYVWQAARRALLASAEIQFAAGAQAVMPVHESATLYRNWPQAQRAIAELVMRPLHSRVVSAHVMGGCAMGPEAKRAAADLTGRYHHLDNVFIFDGSLFPTSIGANPQLSIYGLVAKLATGLAKQAKV